MSSPPLASVSSPAIAYTIWANARQRATGKRPPVLSVNLALVLLLPLVVFGLLGRPLSLRLSRPRLVQHDAAAW